MFKPNKTLTIGNDDDDNDNGSGNEMVRVKQYFDAYLINSYKKPPITLAFFSLSEEIFKYFTMDDKGTISRAAAIASIVGSDIDKPIPNIYFNVSLQKWKTLPSKPVWEQQTGFIKYDDNNDISIFCPLKFGNYDLYIDENGKLNNKRKISHALPDPILEPKTFFTFERNYFLKYNKVIDMGNNINNQYYFEWKNSKWQLQECDFQHEYNDQIKSCQKIESRKQTTFKMASMPRPQLQDQPHADEYQYLNNFQVKCNFIYMSNANLIHVKHISNNYAAVTNHIYFNVENKRFIQLIKQENFTKVGDIVPCLYNPYKIYRKIINGDENYDIEEEEFSIPILVTMDETNSSSNIVVFMNEKYKSIFELYKNSMRSNWTKFPFIQYHKYEMKNKCYIFCVLGKTLVHVLIYNETPNENSQYKTTFSNSNTDLALSSSDENIEITITSLSNDTNGDEASSNGHENTRKKSMSDFHFPIFKEILEKKFDLLKRIKLVREIAIYDLYDF